MSRAVVIEAKQRFVLTATHVTKVGNDYRDGSPKASGVLIVNYDDAPASTCPLRVTVLGGVRPGSVGALEMRREIKQLTRMAGLHARPPAVVLLDVSDSMAGHYKNKATRDALRSLFTIEYVKVAHFNERLLGGDDIFIDNSTPIATTGGTDLDRSFKELMRQIGPFETLLVVSDGEYDDAPSVQQVRFRKRVLPSQLSSTLAWLVDPTEPTRSDDPAFGLKTAR